MCLDRAQLEDYNQNNYSGFTPAWGLLANDRHNIDDSILSCLHLYMTRVCANIVCVYLSSLTGLQHLQTSLKKTH